MHQTACLRSAHFTVCTLHLNKKIFGVKLLTKEKSLQVTLKKLHVIQSSNHTPQYLVKWVGNWSPHKQHTSIYSNFTHNGPRLEATEMSFNKWMDKLWSVHIMEYYSALKMSCLTWLCHWVKEVSLKRLSAIWFLHYYIWKRQNYGNRKNINGSQRLEGKKGGKTEHGGYLGQWKYSVWYHDGRYMSLYLFQNP